MFSDIQAQFIGCDQLQILESINKKRLLQDNTQTRNLELAYLKQACNICKKNSDVIGFKAGLTSKNSQNKFNSNTPIFGVLTKGNKSQSNKIIIKEGIYLLETELAFRIKKEIKDLKQINAEISQLVDAVAPAIEVPKIKGSSLNSVTLNSLVEANAGAHKFILGEFVPLDKANINQTEIQILSEGKVLRNGISSRPLNDQESAMYWLMKKALREGYTIPKGAVLLTGTITKPLVLRDSQYKINFSQLGEIIIEVSEVID